MGVPPALSPAPKPSRKKPEIIDVSPLPDWALVPVETARTVLGMSRARFYDRVADGKLQTIRDGKRRYVRKSELEAYVLRLQAV